MRPKPLGPDQIWVIGQHVHGLTMEGLELDPETRADVDAYVAGELHGDMVLQRAQERVRAVLGGSATRLAGA